jgi:hypothetical protein
MQSYPENGRILLANSARKSLYKPRHDFVAHRHFW